MGNIESLHMKEVTGSEREKLQKRASMRGPIPPPSSGTFKSSPLFQSNGNNQGERGGGGRGMNGVHRISENTNEEDDEESQRNSTEMVSSRRGSFEFDLSGGTPVSSPVTPENRKK